MNRLASVGASVRQTTMDTMMAAVAVSANSLNKRPTMPSMNSSGVKAATSDTLMDTTVNPISLVPFKAASRMPAPASRCRWMFSMTTMASSTMKPTATTIATKVRLFRLNPANDITANVATSDTPSTADTIRVADTCRRKAAITAITSTMATTSVSCTSCSDERMVRVRSL
ncbi:hypothetical protein D3C71_1153930 [compost metagenome]